MALSYHRVRGLYFMAVSFCGDYKSAGNSTLDKVCLKLKREIAIEEGKLYIREIVNMQNIDIRIIVRNNN